MSLFSADRPKAGGSKKSAPIGLIALAKKLGRDKGQVSRWATEHADFPKQVGPGGVKYIPEDAEEWIAANIMPRGGRIPSQVFKANEDDPDIIALKSGKASPIDISRFTVQLASKRLATAAVAGTMTSNELLGLKNALQELRSAESDYIDLEKSRGELLARSLVIAIVGECVSRLVRAAGIIETTLATEISAWLAAPDATTMAADAWAKKVREFVATKCNEVRRAEADGIDRLIAQATDDSK